MNDMMVEFYVKSQDALRQIAATLESRRERGADALEYVGMIVLAAILVIGLFNAARGIDLGAVFTENANEILGGGR